MTYGVTHVVLPPDRTISPSYSCVAAAQKMARPLSTHVPRAPRIGLCVVHWHVWEENQLEITAYTDAIECAGFAANVLTGDYHHGSFGLAIYGREPCTQHVAQQRVGVVGGRWQAACIWFTFDGFSDAVRVLALQPPCAKS